jgi:NAD(P)-dependent dehydrogenase (short-subunit alcohol dehydrogenase family)
LNQLANKKLVIIGGTTGMGLSAAKAFVNEGAQVVVCGRNIESVKEAEKILGHGGKAINGDATLPGTAPNAIDICINEFGGFHGLYHVAGGSGRKLGDGPLHELNIEGWNSTFELNLTSLMLSNQAAVRAFAEIETGRNNLEHWIYTRSFLLHQNISLRTHYAAAKSAVIGFTKSIAAYYSKDNIRINVIVPALVETPMAQRAAKDEEILSFIKTKTTPGRRKNWSALWTSMVLQYIL